MDQTDRRIVRELQKNARLTNNELAERVNLSPSPCLRRVRNLERQGVLQGYTAIIDYEKYGLPISVFVSVKLHEHSEESVQAFERSVKDVDEILECYLMAGSQDYLLHIVTPSLKAYERFMKETLHRIPGISAIESNFAIGVVKRAHDLPSLSG